MDRLRGVVKDYDWGDDRALADLLGHAPPGRPEAEYWLGTHPGGPAVLIGADGGERSLDVVVGRDPEATLGPAVRARFGDLPFLLKVLAAARPLSIQAHPDLERARAGFAEEEERGIDRAAPGRNYRDPNHKPELICALTRFEAKCGFRPLADSRRLVGLLADELGDGRLDRLAGWLDGDGPAEQVLRATVARLLRLPPPDAADLAAAVAAAAARAARSPGSALLADHGPEVAWTARIAEAFPGDVGVVVAWLLNHVVLAPGEALFLAAGNLHSYLSGVGVELMANSDNVLRGGLTSKHVDVEELLRVVDWRPGPAPVQVPAGPAHRYDVPVPEFALQRLDSSAGPIPGEALRPIGPELILVTAGSVGLRAPGRPELVIDAGGAAFVAHADGPYRLDDRAPGRTLAWRASVGGGGRRGPAGQR